MHIKHILEQLLFQMKKLNTNKNMVSFFMQEQVLLKIKIQIKKYNKCN